MNRSYSTTRIWCRRSSIRCRAISWKTTEKPANAKPRSGRKRNLYLTEKYMLWAITETPLGHLRREYLYETLLYLRPKSDLPQ